MSRSARLAAAPSKGRAARIPQSREPAGKSVLEREKKHDEIYEKIYAAVLEHRLQPGTKLAEERLAAIFQVSRARIREVLARLAHEQIVELYPQRGAYVAKPTIEQALDVFEARRLIEPAVVRRLISVLQPQHVERLRQHQALEEDARRRNDKRAIVRLSGEFHTLLASLRKLGADAQHARTLYAHLPDYLPVRYADSDQLPRRRAYEAGGLHRQARCRTSRESHGRAPQPHRGKSRPLRFGWRCGP